MRGFWVGALAVALAGATVLAACSSSDTTGPGTNGLSGTWRFQENLNNAQIGLSCTDSAQVALTQAGQAFTATYNQVGSCTAGGQVFDNSGPGSITNGRVAGDSVTFNEAICNYSGRLAAGSPARSMAGTVMCTDTTAQPVTVTGNWTMTR